MASVTHHTPIRKAVPRTILASNDSPSIGVKTITAKRIGPSTKPILLISGFFNVR